jgi:hypothetical protein
VSASIFEHFAPVPDFRMERKKVYPLPEILLLVVSGVLSGANGWEAIEQFGRSKLDWPRKFSPFADGIPSHDCIAYVISGLSPKAFQACFASWMRAVSEATGGELIAIDGKTARGSRDRRRGKSALHMVRGQRKGHQVKEKDTHAPPRSRSKKRTPTLRPGQRKGQKNKKKDTHALPPCSAPPKCGCPGCLLGVYLLINSKPVRRTICSA